MSSSPSFPSPSFQPKRNSQQTTQLPLSSPTRSQFSPTASDGSPSAPPTPKTASSSPATPQRPRGMSVVANRALGIRPSSPTSPGMSPHSRSTHTGGIQPSMSFFRPSRPNYDDTYSRPSSAASSIDVIQHSEAFQLSSMGPALKSQPGTTAEGNTDDGITMEGEQLDDGEPGQNMLMGKSKHSREPLLPTSSRPGGLGARPSMSGRDGGKVGLGASLSTSSSQQDGSKRLSGVRNSIDRIFNLSRGLSIDSLRRQAVGEEDGDARLSPIKGRRTPVDGYNAHFRNRSSVSPSPYKRTSSSAGHFAGVPKRHSQSVSMSRNTPISISPEPSFVSHPPEMSPPLSHVPVKDAKTGRLVRRYERHPSRNRFFFGGRLLSGGDSPWAFIICLTLVLGICGVWFGTTCVWWWHNESPAVAAVGAYMSLLVISCMLATAFSDPGILPRNLDPTPPYSPDSETPLPRDVRVRNDSVRVKYCPTCKIYRPPRASHCKMCDNCVDGCDHHCQWVNNCVGRRNYTYFFVLLLTATLTLVLVICTSALHLYLLTRKEDIDFPHALREGPGSAVAFCLAICIIWPVAALLTYHVRVRFFLLRYEKYSYNRPMLNQAHKSLMLDSAPPNPFTHGSWMRNLVELLCRPRGTSWLDGMSPVTEDKRKVNPGMFDHIWDGGSGLGASENHVQQS
ncbi:hypothetical protein M378DRAFT_82746 [Amanita muscaria Koide BX008]|uniref:Palmitoyltransferase n=1 Tax=Amanita muscaria (strain Koide BX008) TaxID=946122 RepID=A0A0C2T462_AMAMK|nr:hypothetical protein M378DRAFT_82746 [Amanita muscaria Koide BX008]